MSDTPETDRIERRWRDYALLSFDDVFDLTRRLERERNEAREQVKELIRDNENLYRRLESIHDVYRLSSVCRELKLENEKLKQKQP